VSGTNVAAVKARLVGKDGLLRAVVGSSVQVFYDAPAQPPREYVCGIGDVDSEGEAIAFRGNARFTRQEDATLRLEARVYDPGRKDREEGDTRVAEIASLIVQWIAANPKLGDLPELEYARTVGVNLRGGLDDDGATNSMIITIAFKSILH
jgi:hypothetical protein